MPTFNPAITGRELIQVIAGEFGARPEMMILRKWMIRVFGLMNKTVSELQEMLYQYEQDYYFDATKFNTHFNYTPIPYSEGIHETITFLKNKR